MRRILTIAATQFLMVLRSKGSLVSMLLLPLLFTFIFGAAIEGGSSAKRNPLVLVDNDRSFASRMFIKTLASNESIKLDVTDVDGMNRAFMDRTAANGLVIPKGFQKSLDMSRTPRIDLLNTPDATMNIAVKPVIQGALTEIISNYTLSKRIGGRNRYQRVTSVRRDTGVVVQSISLKPNSKEKAKSSTSSETPARAVGFSILFVMMLVFNMGGFLLRERRQGTWGRLLTAPVDRFSILCGYILSFFVAGMFQFIILVIATTLIFNVGWGPIVPLMAVAGAYTLCSAGLGLFVASMVKTVEQQAALGILIVNATSMLGGAYWPLDFVSPIMRRIGYMTPQAWAMEGFTEVMIRGANWSALVLPLGVLLAFSAIFMSVGLMRVRFEA